MLGFGFSEIIIFFAFFGHSFGVPVGVPPEADVPLISAVAPDQCLFYAAWNGTGAPDPNANVTERWMARDKILAAATRIREKVLKSFRIQADFEGPHDEMLVRLANEIFDHALFRSTAAFVADASDPAELSGGIVIDVDMAIASKLKEEFAALQKLLPPEWQPREFTVEENTFRAFKIPDSGFDCEIAYGVRGQLVIIGFGKDAIAKIDHDARTPEPAWLSEMKRELPVVRRSSVSYFGIRGFVEMLDRRQPSTTPHNAEPLDRQPMELGTGEFFAVPAEVEKVIQLRSIESIQSVAGLDDAGFVCRHRIVTQRPLKGILSMLETPAMSDGQIAALSQGIDIGLSVKLSIDNILRFLEQMTALYQEDMEDSYREFEKTFGMDLKKDVLRHFNGAVTFSSKLDTADPESGHLLQFGINDEMEIYNSWSQFNSVIEDLCNESSNIKFSRHEMGNTEVLKANADFGFFALTPTWCLYHGRVHISLDDDTIQKAIESKSEATLADGDKRMASLLAAEKAAGKPNPNGMAYLNVAKLLGELMGSASMFHDPDAPFDIDDLPNARILSEGVEPSIGAYYLTDRGVEVVQRQTIPSAAPGASLTAFGLAAAPSLLSRVHSIKLDQSRKN